MTPDAVPVELTILMPCLNEAETVGRCIEKAQSFLRANDVSGEVVVADNGSSDGSPTIAGRLGARVISVEERGYGAVLMSGILESRGKYIIMGDADNSYDFAELMPYLKALRDGNHLVMGNRFRGGIKPGAMPHFIGTLETPSSRQSGDCFSNPQFGIFIVASEDSSNPRL